MKTPTETGKAARPRIRDKRQAILDAALKVFAAGGVNGVPIPALAEQAQVGTGTIYRYFSSKEALVNELFRSQRQFKRDLLFDGLDRSLPARARALRDGAHGAPLPPSRMLVLHCEKGKHCALQGC